MYWPPNVRLEIYHLGVSIFMTKYDFELKKKVVMAYFNGEGGKYVLENTRLAEEYRAGKFQVLEPEAYYELVADAVELLPEDCIIHRLTGDGPKKSLIAPLWSGNKKRVMADMQKALRQRGIVAYQEKEHHK